MFDPQPAISKAFYTALTTPALLLNSEVFDVYSHVPNNKNQYLLIGEPIAVQGSGAISCIQWECSLQLSIYTCFPLQNIVSDAPAYVVSEQVMQRLLNQRLALDAGFTMSPIEVSFTTNIPSSDNVNQYVNRIIRLKFTIYR